MKKLFLLVYLTPSLLLASQAPPLWMLKDNTLVPISTNWTIPTSIISGGTPGSGDVVAAANNVFTGQNRFTDITRIDTLQVTNKENTATFAGPVQANKSLNVLSNLVAAYGITASQGGADRPSSLDNGAITTDGNGLLTVSNINVSGTATFGTIAAGTLTGPVASKLLAADANSNTVAGTWANVVPLASDFPVTNNNAAAVTLANTGNQFTGAFFAPTNAVNTGTFAAGGAYRTNITGDIVLGNFSGVPNDKVWGIYIFVTNSAAATHTVTFPGSCSPNSSLAMASPVFYVTNGQWATFQVHGWGQLVTNISWEPHK